MMNKNTLWPVYLLCLFLAMVTNPTRVWSVEPEQIPFNFEKTQTRIKEISRLVKTGKISPQQLDSAKQQVKQFTLAATSCIDTATTQVSGLDQEIASLGPATEHDYPQIIKERKNLQKQKQALMVSLSECRLSATLTARLENELADQDKLLQAASFFARSENFFGSFTKNLPTTASFTEELREYIPERFGVRDLPLHIRLILLLLVVAGAFAGFNLFRLLQRRLISLTNRQDAMSNRTYPGMLTLPIAMAALFGGGYLFYINPNSQPAVFGPWLFFSLGIYCAAHFFFHLRRRLQPSPPAGANRFNILVLLAVLLFFSTRLDLAGFDALATLVGLAQSIVICALCCCAWYCLWPIKLPEKLNHLEKSRKAVITLVPILVIIVEVSGYRNFSLYILQGVLGTFLLATLLRLCLLSMDLAIGGFSAGKYEWQKGLRIKLGITAKDNLTGLTWIKLIFKVLAWALCLWLFMQIWGLTDAEEKRIHTFLMDGFTIGGLTIAPARIFFGVFIFACGWTLISWIKMQMEKRWLKKAGYSRSAQETMVTMTGYCGFAMALIVGLSVAGFSFRNLAVIAGALSVGIGFGMQNIVNNFVSGLIILFERPVKRGDWIKIGATEGYVQKISIRSTLIQTFDRSDVIVPNSELIAGQVTNMMLNDNFGRLVVPVGVAYGSDTDLVRTVLLDIAANNEDIINDGSAPKPVVLFLAFGDSSLNFELRCHLANIDKRLLVKSAINFEIDRAFRKNKISMPFPQRDLYIKEFPGQNPVAASLNEACGKSAE